MKRVLMNQFSRTIKQEFQDLMNQMSLSKIPALRKELLAVNRENLKNYIRNNELNSDRINQENLINRLKQKVLESNVENQNCRNQILLLYQQLHLKEEQLLVQEEMSEQNLEYVQKLEVEMDNAKQKIKMLNLQAQRFGLKQENAESSSLFTLQKGHYLIKDNLEQI